jgi:thymidylate synthase
MLGLSLRTHDVRDLFKALLAQKQFTSINREASMTGLVGNTTIEIVGASFIADEPAIFGEVNWDWVKREEEWYYSQSLNVNDIPGGAPAIWKAVADKDGFINSNYGFLIFSPKNGITEMTSGIGSAGIRELSQYDLVLEELKRNPASRRAQMIYTRPTMWADYNKNGRSDFCCTDTVQYLIRDGALHSLVRMRSNDAIFGYKGDRAWQLHVLEKLANDLQVPVGKIYWNVGSLHVYERHYHLVDPTWKNANA